MALDRIDGPVVLTIPTDPASLFLVRGIVERLAVRLDFAKEEVDRMVLAVDEACTNVIRYAYGNRPGQRIVITFCVAPSQLEIRIRDFGEAADPATFAPRELSDIRPGGLGIHFIRCAMDTVDYETPPDGGMLLRMVKFRKPQGGPER